MRKIEQQLIAAIRNWKDFKLDNTIFRVTNDENLGHVYLHGNLIAIIYKQGRAVLPFNDTTQRWDTRTTRSRMRALGCTMDRREPGLWTVASLGTDPIQLELPFLV